MHFPPCIASRQRFPPCGSSGRVWLFVLDPDALTSLCHGIVDVVGVVSFVDILALRRKSGEMIGGILWTTCRWTCGEHAEIPGMMRRGSHGSLPYPYLSTGRCERDRRSLLEQGASAELSMLISDLKKLQSQFLCSCTGSFNGNLVPREVPTSFAAIPRLIPACSTTSCRTSPVVADVKHYQRDVV